MSRNPRATRAAVCCRISPTGRGTGAIALRGKRSFDVAHSRSLRMTDAWCRATQHAREPVTRRSEGRPGTGHPVAATDESLTGR